MQKSARIPIYAGDSLLQIQTLVLVAVDVFGSALIAIYQAVTLMIALVTIAFISALFSPLKSASLRKLEIASSLILALTLALSLYFVTGASYFVETTAAVSQNGVNGVWARSEAACQVKGRRSS